MEPTKKIDKRILKERTLASYKKHKKNEYDPRDAQAKFLTKVKFGFL
jgi:hypothetical protein